MAKSIAKNKNKADTKDYVPKGANMDFKLLSNEIIPKDRSDEDSNYAINVPPIEEYMSEEQKKAWQESRKDFEFSKTIWMYRHDGFSDCPSKVQECLDSWESKNSDWKINLLDKRAIDTNFKNCLIDIKEDIKDFDKKDIRDLDIEDIVRLRIIRDYGGVFIDYNRKCPSMKLDDWVYKNLQGGFFAFTKQEDPIRPENLIDLHKFFIIGFQDSLLATAWYSELIKFWNENDKNTIGEDLLGEIFKSLYRRYADIRQEWNYVPKPRVDFSYPHTITRAVCDKY